MICCYCRMSHPLRLAPGGKGGWQNSTDLRDVFQGTEVSFSSRAPQRQPEGTGLSARAARAKHHRLCGLNNRSLFCHSSGGCKSQTKIRQGSVSAKSSLPGLQTATLSPHDLSRVWLDRESALLSFLVRTRILWDPGPTLRTSFCPNYLLRGPISKYRSIWSQGSNVNLGVRGHKIQSITMPKMWKREKRETGRPTGTGSEASLCLQSWPCWPPSSVLPPPSKDL